MIEGNKTVAFKDLCSSEKWRIIMRPHLTPELLRTVHDIAKMCSWWDIDLIEINNLLDMLWCEAGRKDRPSALWREEVDGLFLADEVDWPEGHRALY